MRPELAVHFQSDRVDWETPPELFRRWDEEFHFTVDVCATAANTKCAKFFSLEQDGLAQDWRGERCWMNPPYGRGIRTWVAKAAESGALVVALLPARTDTAWFHTYVLERAEVVFLRGRVRFVGGATSAPFPSMVAIWRPAAACAGCGEHPSGALVQRGEVGCGYPASGPVLNEGRRGQW